MTNVQEAGVDEGGIVKRAGDANGALQRGSRFWIETRDDFDPEDYGGPLVGGQVLISAQLKRPGG